MGRSCDPTVAGVAAAPEVVNRCPGQQGGGRADDGRKQQDRQQAGAVDPGEQEVEPRLHHRPAVAEREHRKRRENDPEGDPVPPRPATRVGTASGASDGRATSIYAPLPSGYAQGVPLLLLMIFLLVRPTGLLRARA